MSGIFALSWQVVVFKSDIKPQSHHEYIWFERIKSACRFQFSLRLQQKMLIDNSGRSLPIENSRPTPPKYLELIISSFGFFFFQKSTAVNQLNFQMNLSNPDHVLCWYDSFQKSIEFWYPAHAHQKKKTEC